MVIKRMPITAKQQCGNVDDESENSEMLKMRMMKKKAIESRQRVVRILFVIVLTKLKLNITETRRSTFGTKPLKRRAAVFKSQISLLTQIKNMVPSLQNHFNYRTFVTLFPSISLIVDMSISACPCYRNKSKKK